MGSDGPIGWRSIVLGWCPERIARAAMNWPLRKAWLVGTVSVFLQLLAPTVAAFAWLDEPFPTLGVYLVRAVQTLPFAAVVLLVTVAPILGVLVVGDRLQGPRERANVQRRIFCLAPTATLVPGLVWSGFNFLAILADPGNNLTAGVKPPWLTSWVVQLLGSYLWLVLLLILANANARAAYAIVQPMFDACHRCTTCGYNLTGNVSGVCPECGTAIRAEARNRQ